MSLKVPQSIVLKQAKNRLVAQRGILKWLRYLILSLGLLFLGCEIHSQQIIKPEKLDFSQIKFDAVTKKLIDESSVDVKEADDMKKIINYWFDNKIKTDGFDGNLNVYLKDIVINKVRNDEILSSSKLMFL
jgi:hypothetical protein